MSFTVIIIIFMFALFFFTPFLTQFDEDHCLYFKAMYF